MWCWENYQFAELYEQSKDVAKFISYTQTSPGEKNCKIDDITSSDNAGVRRAVILPIPLAEDHLTIVSWQKIKKHLALVQEQQCLMLSGKDE